MDLPRYWQSVNPISLLLLPLAGLFRLVAWLRRLGYRAGLSRIHTFDAPVIVVGNITVGGTGKTPLVIWLCQHLAQLGYRPGIVSRGYGGKSTHWPQQVRADSDPATVGDEAVLLAQRTGCPVCVGPDRPAAVEALLTHTDVDVVVSDDGMQHYAMGRDLEIAVIDGKRRFGNGWPLPAGPMREPRSRLERVDMVVSNGEPQAGEFAMQFAEPVVYPLNGGQPRSLADLAGRSVHAVAGIGHPARFFDMLRRHKLTVHEHAFADHHDFTASDLNFAGDMPTLMTEKDAVKCRRLVRGDYHVVRVDARPDDAFADHLNTLLQEKLNG